MEGLALKSKLSSVLVVCTAARRTRSGVPTQWVLLLGAALNLILQQAGEEVEVGPLPVHGLAMAGLEGIEDAGEAQLLERRRQVMLCNHEASPPKRWPSRSLAVRTT